MVVSSLQKRVWWQGLGICSTLVSTPQSLVWSLIGNLDLRLGWEQRLLNFQEVGTPRPGIPPTLTHLVKESILTDELLTSLGVDGDGEANMCHQELRRRKGWAQKRSDWPSVS